MDKISNTIIPINVNFYYNYTDEYNEKQTDKITIIEKGKFSMKKIRNINFYNELETNKKLNLETLNTNDLILCLPYSKNYITQENLDLVVTEKEKKLDITINKKNTLLELIDEYEPLSSKIDSITNFNTTNKTELTKDIIIQSISNNSKKNDNMDEFERKAFNKINTDNITYLNFIDFKNFLINIKEIKSDVKFKIILDKKISEGYQTKFSNALKNLIQNIPEKYIYENFNNKNYKDFFTIRNEENLITYFNELKQNFDDNINYESIYNSKNLNYKEISSPPKNLNNKKDLIEIIYKFGQYLLQPEIYKKYKSDKKALYEFVIKNENLIKNIITYYNIFTILTKIYIIEDTIIENENFEDKNHLKYVKNIKCVNQIEKTNKKNLLITDDNNRNFINVYFEIDYENINENNIINFYINLINTENYILNNINKKKVRDYINYNTKIFTKKTNIFKYIFLSNKLDYKKLINNFFMLKDNPILKKENPDNIIEILLNKNIINNLFNKSISNYYIKEKLKDEDLEKLLTDIFIHKIFFKKDNILYLNNKFYTINKVEFAEKIIKEMKTPTCNNNNGNGTQNPTPVERQPTKKDANINNCNMNNFIITNSHDNRLSLFEINIKYSTYLNVYCFIKNSKDEKIKFKDKFNAILNCNDKASTLDLLFKKLLGETYNYNTFKNLIGNKGNKGNKEIEETENKELIENKDIKKEKPPLDNIGNLQDDYLSAGGIKKNKLYKKNKIYKLEKKFKKNKRKNSYKNKRNNISNKTIKLINLYLKN